MTETGGETDITEMTQGHFPNLNKSNLQTEVA